MNDSAPASLPTPDKRTAPDAGHGTMASYTGGFLLSVALTFLAYVFVDRHTFTGTALIGAILALAVVQFVVQMLFFLHLGRESKPRWNFTLLLFMLLVLIILVFGSIWIMNNLDYHHMTPRQQGDSIIKDEGIPENHLH